LFCSKLSEIALPLACVGKGSALALVVMAEIGEAATAQAQARAIAESAMLRTAFWHRFVCIF
jgi:hypothetical protein